MKVIINGIDYIPSQERFANVRLCDALKQNRKNLNMALAEMAKEIGCSQSYLHEIESGKSIPSLYFGYYIHRAYGIPMIDVAYMAVLQLEARHK